jgi:hypothetical protein
MHKTQTFLYPSQPEDTETFQQKCTSSRTHQNNINSVKREHLKVAGE